MARTSSALAARLLFIYILIALPYCCSVSATALPSTVIHINGSYPLRHHGLFTDEESGLEYDLWRHDIPQTVIQQYLGNKPSLVARHETPTPVERPRKLGKNWSKIQYKVYKDQLKCHIWQTPNNVWQCGLKYSFLPYALEYAQIHGNTNFRRMLAHMLGHLFHEKHRVLHGYRSQCLQDRKNGPMFCMSWDNYFIGSLDFETVFGAIDEALTCLKHDMSSAGQLRFRDGSNHVVCFSNRASDCRDELCKRDAVAWDPEKDYAPGYTPKLEPQRENFTSEDPTETGPGSGRSTMAPITGNDTWRFEQ